MADHYTHRSNDHPDYPAPTICTRCGNDADMCVCEEPCNCDQALGLADALRDLMLATSHNFDHKTVRAHGRALKVLRYWGLD